MPAPLASPWLTYLHAVDNLALATRLAYPGSVQTMTYMQAGGCAYCSLFDLVAIGLVYMAYPNGCRQKLPFLL